MKTVWKFVLKIDDWQTIKMPSWAIVGSNNPPIDRTFRITGTGNLVEPELGHVGSVQMRLGSMGKGPDQELVWHVWEPVMG